MVTLALALVGAGCGGSGETTPTKVVLVTHDSFAISKEAKAAFEAQTGLELQILQSGDAGAVLNTALLTAGDPQGDVLFGVDNTLLSRALAGDLLEPYASPALDSVRAEYPAPDPRVTPIDHGEVCLNVDRSGSSRKRLAPPRSLADLARPRTATSSWLRTPRPRVRGLAFLLATVATFGDDGLARLLARAARERRAGRGRLGGGVHAGVLRCRGQPRQAPDRRLVRHVARGGGDLRSEEAGDRADRSARRGLLPTGRVRGDPEGRAERGGRPRARRLHALAAASRPTCRARCS